MKKVKSMWIVLALLCFLAASGSNLVSADQNATLGSPFGSIDDGTVELMSDWQLLAVTGSGWLKSAGCAVANGVSAGGIIVGVGAKIVGVAIPWVGIAIFAVAGLSALACSF